MRNPEKKFSKIREEFYTIVQDTKGFNESIINELNLDQEEIKDLIQEEVEYLITQLTDLEREQSELLNKENLTEEEYEELALLNEIITGIQELKKLAEDYMEDIKLSRETVLGSGNLKLIVDSREEFNISNIDILSAVTNNLLKRKPIDIVTLQELTFSDTDIEDLAYNRMDYSICLLLPYFSISENQKKYIIDHYDIEQSHSKVVSELLSTGKLPNDFQNKLIEDISSWSWLQEFRGEQGTLYDHISSDIDRILNNKNLSDKQKTKIVSKLVLVGSPTDCMYLLKKHSRFIDKETEKTAKERVKKYELKLKNLQELSPEKLKGKKIHFVTHPFYDLYSRNFDFISGQEKTSEEILETILVSEMRKAIKEFKNFKIPPSYTQTFDIFRELETYTKLIQDKEAIIVFIIPKENKEEVYGHDEKLFKSIMNRFQSDNVFYVESYSPVSGDLKTTDMNFLKDLLKDTREIDIRGGYIGCCLKASSDDLGLLNEKIRITKDYSESTTSNKFRSRRKPNKRTHKRWSELKLPSSPDDIQSIKDVIKIFQENQEFTDTYEKWLFETTKEIQKNQPKIRHRK